MKKPPSMVTTAKVLTGISKKPSFSKLGFADFKVSAGLFGGGAR